MTRKLFLLTALVAAPLAAYSLAQSRDYQSTVMLGDDVTSRRRVGKAADVKASVVVNAKAVESAAFDRLNQKRAASGLSPLAWSEDLATIARTHSRNMADFKFFSHRGRDNKMVSDRADDIGLKKWQAIGENIAFNRGYQDPVERAVELWLDSPAHRRNLMNDEWRESAVGVAITEDGSYYFTQVFMKR
jgi:uncharacterized protein YkwD